MSTPSNAPVPWDRSQEEDTLWGYVTLQFPRPYSPRGADMEAAAHEHHEHHAMPTSGRALDAVALSATLHCLTGCALGEVAGMIIGTALGFSQWGTVALSVALA